MSCKVLDNTIQLVLCGAYHAHAMSMLSAPKPDEMVNAFAALGSLKSSTSPTLYNGEYDGNKWTCLRQNSGLRVDQCH